MKTGKWVEKRGHESISLESKMPSNDLSPYYTPGKSQPRHKAIGNNASWIVLFREQTSFLSARDEVQINSTT